MTITEINDAEEAGGRAINAVRPFTGISTNIRDDLNRADEILTMVRFFANGVANDPENRIRYEARLVTFLTPTEE